MSLLAGTLLIQLLLVSTTCSKDAPKKSTTTTNTSSASTARAVLGCDLANYFLVNSLPKSCNEALETITSKPLLGLGPGDIGDMCNSYCLNPLKGAAEECVERKEDYRLVSALCCSSGTDTGTTRGQRQGQSRCFDLLRAVNTELNIAHRSCNSSTATITSCSRNCSTTLQTVYNTMDLCFNEIFNTTAAKGEFPIISNQLLWDACNLTRAEGNLCSGGHRTVSALTSFLLFWVALLATA